MTVEKRQYPRVPCEHSGHMEVRYRGQDHAFHRRLLDVNINSLAPGGAGVAFSDTELESLDAGTEVTLRFHPNDHDEMEIPGRVAWCKGRAVGVCFQLELAANDTRRDYARWIVDQLVASGQSPTSRSRRITQS